MFQRAIQVLMILMVLAAVPVMAQEIEVPVVHTVAVGDGYNITMIVPHGAGWWNWSEGGTAVSRGGTVVAGESKTIPSEVPNGYIDVTFFTGEGGSEVTRWEIWVLPTADTCPTDTEEYGPWVVEQWLHNEGLSAKFQNGNVTVYDHLDGQTYDFADWATAVDNGGLKACLPDSEQPQDFDLNTIVTRTFGDDAACDVLETEAGITNWNGAFGENPVCGPLWDENNMFLLGHSDLQAIVVHFYRVGDTWFSTSMNGLRAATYYWEDIDGQLKLLVAFQGLANNPDVYFWLVGKGSEGKPFSATAYYDSVSEEVIVYDGFPQPLADNLADLLSQQLRAL